MADLWSDYTELLLSDIEPELKAKYGIAIRDLLNNPAKYANTNDIDTVISNMKEAANGAIDDREASLKDEQNNLQKDAAKADVLTAQIGQAISAQAKQNKVPVVKPMLFARDESGDEVVYVDAVDIGTLALVERLMASALYVADYTTTYQNYKVGDWVFISVSGRRNVIIRECM